jgi:HEAT repeat protein
VRTILGVALLGWAALTATAADTSELVKKLSSKDNEARRAAARELSELGADAKPALKALVKALKDEDRFVRRFAAQALGGIGPDAKEAAPALTKLVEDDAPQVREAAVKALAKLGAAGVPALTKALAGPADVKELAIAALGEAGKDGIPGLTAVIKDGKASGALRRKAIEALPKGKEGRAALTALVEVVKSPPRGGDGNLVRVDAINALGRLASSDDKAAVSALTAIVKDEKLRNNQLKNASKKALAAVQKRKP